VVPYVSGAAWLLGLEGVALLRAQAGDFDETFVRARLSEVATIVGAMDGPELGRSSQLEVLDVEAAYAGWADDYGVDDHLIVAEQPVLTGLLEELPRGTVLDAACGTGRVSRILRNLGHDVVGVDLSAEMLARNDASPGARGRLDALPVRRGAVDHVVCALSLLHVDDLAPVFAEFARVMRPGGTLVTSDMHVISVYLGGVPVQRDRDGNVGVVPVNRFHAGDYVTAALHAGFEVTACAEPRWPEHMPAGGPGAARWCPDAAAAVYVDVPIALVWSFRLRSPGHER
jgi:SAM-dependent methyltransferase